MILSDWKRKFKNAANLLESNSNGLCKLDSVIGDGDHGITISRISSIILEYDKRTYDDAASYFTDMGWDITNAKGGSAGPLWGTFIGGFANAYEKNPNPTVCEVFKSGLDVLCDITQAKEGDKTMMDALIPAIRAMEGLDGDEALKAGSKAAAMGAEKTAEIAARFGRAKNYGEKSVGHKDAGACSIALLIKGLAEG